MLRDKIKKALLSAGHLLVQDWREIPGGGGITSHWDEGMLCVSIQNEQVILSFFLPDDEVGWVFLGDINLSAGEMAIRLALDALPRWADKVVDDLRGICIMRGDRNEQ